MSKAMITRALRASVFVAIALGFVACDVDEEGRGTPDIVSTQCNESNEACGVLNCSGEDEEMLPGSNCLVCHAQGVPGEASEEKVLTAAGTIFVDADGSAPVAGVVVRLVEANGEIHETTSNRVGNFLFEQGITFPVTASVIKGGETLTMGSEVMLGACSSCHRCDGAAGGKLFAP
jgi:hypothetical protein